MIFFSFWVNFKIST